ncbi:TVP38/TMEM64 family protein [Oceanirhabdus seepicola]|uniref:TVP38/TMEM64 family membrane protein n=1 Tax=Oceanirhabdus seepicola TaxID=2828781 RepID=A0A9J6NYU5_9CLOT|nr:VTT domain-containing protein [Oceanirhabdus seepicola]MCM1989443.1 VTT domain-containing protein [Oceanirhabdus seepicola]
MRRRNKVLLIISIWMVLAVVLYKEGLLTTDINKINEVIGTNPVKMRVIFVLLSSFRVILFIPQTVFIFIGSVLFGAYEGFVLSFIALIISQTIMYIVGRYFQRWFIGEKYFEKNKELIAHIKTYGYKFLALALACPVLPSDAITLTAACMKLDYKKYMLTIILAASPVIFLYGFMGEGFQRSNGFIVIAAISVILISYYTLRIWKKINLKNKKGE